MTLNDPFATQPSDEAQVETEAPEQPVEAPKVASGGKTPAKAKSAAGASSEGGVTVTFKGGVGFDSPWIVIHATSLQDAADQVNGDNAVVLSELMGQVQKAGAHFSGQAPARPAAQAGSNPSAPPRGATEPPASAPPSPGAGWVYRSKLSPKTGKVWHAWMPPQGDDVSKPLFFNP